MQQGSRTKAAERTVQLRAMLAEGGPAADLASVQLPLPLVSSVAPSSLIQRCHVFATFGGEVLARSSTAQSNVETHLFVAEQVTSSLMVSRLSSGLLKGHLYCAVQLRLQRHLPASVSRQGHLQAALYLVPLRSSELPLLCLRQ